MLNFLSCSNDVPMKSWRFIAIKSHVLWWNPMIITYLMVNFPSSSHWRSINHHEIPRHSIFQKIPILQCFNHQINQIPQQNPGKSPCFPQKSQHFPGVRFTDLDLDEDQLGGIFSWTPPAVPDRVEVGIQHFGKKLQGVHEDFMGIYGDF